MATSWYFTRGMDPEHKTPRTTTSLSLLVFAVRLDLEEERLPLCPSHWLSGKNIILLATPCSTLDIEKKERKKAAMYETGDVSVEHASRSQKLLV